MSAAPRDVSAAWLDQRHYPDLDPRAERALRAAGLSFGDDTRAEQHLREAQELAPGHIAVLVAHYRYHLYKHRFVDAERYARRCLALSARELGLPEGYLDVTGKERDFTSGGTAERFWLFCLQAYGYVLLRCDRRAEGVRALEKVVELDVADQTKTRALLGVIALAAAADEEAQEMKPRNERANATKVLERKS